MIAHRIQSEPLILLIQKVSRHKFTTDHHVQSFVHEAKKLVLHFFAMEVTLSEFCSLESNTIHAPEYGIEVCCDK